MKYILGIDPGLAETGIGIVAVSGGKFSHIHHGVIRTTAKMKTGERLHRIHNELCEVLTRFKPQSAGIEDLFFTRNTSSAFPVAQAKGVVLLALHQYNIETAEYSPPAVKQAIVGYGKADKQQVQNMIRILLNLDAVPKPDHAADALAVAICHANMSAFSAAVSRGDKND